ncbi:hypothetical protein LTR97_004325 [Elasticomyces elasticus]|uniref:RING-type domain-containing protein n=1 Tax=Elasticomyces elasticus TaxID=574655 RepID=A0AAN7W8F7_9PEZI|nr:hypothetical protein LTR97_004325 [Elasticomyces elasticus]
MSDQDLPFGSVFECSVCWTDKDRTTTSFTIDESLVCEACVIDTIQPMFEAALEHDEAFPVRWGGITLTPEDLPGVFPAALSLRYERRSLEIYSHVKVFCKQRVVIGEDELGAAAKLLAIPTHDGEAGEECGCLLGVKESTAPGSITCPDCSGQTCRQCGEPASESALHICSTEQDPFESWVLGQDYQLCPGCDAPAIISEGYNAMICTRCLTHYCYICGGRASEDRTPEHWEKGSPCPKYNARGAENAWQPDPGDEETDEDEEDEDDSDEDDEEDAESDSDDDGSDDLAEFEEYAAEKAAGEASRDESSDENDGGAVVDDGQDEVVDGRPAMSQWTPDNTIEAEWQAALVVRSDAFNTSQQHIVHRIADLLHLPEGLAGEDPEHYRVKAEETATVLKVFVDAVQSFCDLVETRPILSTANIRVLGGKIRTLNKLEPLVIGLSDFFESRLLIEIAQRHGDATTEAQIDEVFDRLLQASRGQSAIWEEFPALLGVFRGHLDWLGEQWRNLWNQIVIKDLSVSVGKRELLSNAELHLQPGRHYVLIGRNGGGKSTPLQALATDAVPGIPRSLRVLFLGQTQPAGNESADDLEGLHGNPNGDIGAHLSQARSRTHVC